MSPTTITLLLSIRKLAESAKANPSSHQLPRLRGEVNYAEKAWVDAGYPDCPELPPAGVDIFICGRRP